MSESLKNLSSGRPPISRQIPQLSAELWTYICRFLTDKQVRRMYSLNRALYQVAMAVRYREVSVGNLEGAGSEGTRRCLSIGDDVELRGKIRSLLFSSVRLGVDENSSSDNIPATEAAIKKVGEQLAVVKVVIARWRSKAQSPELPIAPQFQRPPTPSPRPSVSLTRSFSLSSRRRTREQAVRDEIAADLSSFLGRLPKLTDLTIHHPDPGDEAGREDSWSLSLLPHSESEAPYNTSLLSLTLLGSIAAWKNVIPHFYEWPYLERFSVVVEEGYPNTQDDTYALRLQLAPFIRRHSKTLKRVSFRSARALDLTSLYDGMGWLPHLEFLEIEQPYLLPSSNHSDALNQLLYRHCDTLRSFKWSFVDPSGTNTQSFTLNPQDWYEQPPYHLTLPRLRHLYLNFPGSSNSTLFEGALFYCARHASTITHLSLSGININLSQLNEFLLLIGSKHLVELDISLDVLTSAVFPNLSIKLPALRTLRLGYTSVGRQKSASEPALVDPTGGGILKIPNVPVVKTWQFRQDMAALVLKDWFLAELYLRKCGDRSWREYKVDQVGKLVVKSLPRVEFVNDMYREIFLQL